MADWYYAKNGQQKGPVSSAELKRMAQAGEIGPDDLVFREGGTNWVAASTVAGLFPAGGVSNKATPAPAPRDREEEPPRRGRSRDRDRDLDEVGVLPGEDDDDGRIRARLPDRNYFGDLLLFRKFMTPWVIVIVFWVGVFGIVYFFGELIYRATYMLINFPSFYGFLGLCVLVGSFPLAIIYWRVVCEVIAVAFRIFEALEEAVRILGKIRDK